MNLKNSFFQLLSKFSLEKKTIKYLFIPKIKKKDFLNLNIRYKFIKDSYYLVIYNKIKFTKHTVLGLTVLDLNAISDLDVSLKFDSNANELFLYFINHIVPSNIFRLIVNTYGLDWKLIKKNPISIDLFNNIKKLV